MGFEPTKSFLILESQPSAFDHSATITVLVNLLRFELRLSGTKPDVLPIILKINVVGITGIEPVNLLIPNQAGISVCPNIPINYEQQKRPLFRTIFRSCVIIKFKN